jgi:hypothetical protein
VPPHTKGRKKAVLLVSEALTPNPTYMKSKTLFVIPTDVHYYKSVEILKQFNL